MPWSGMDKIDRAKMDEWALEIASYGEDVDMNYYFEMADQDRHLANAINMLGIYGEAFQKMIEDEEKNGDFIREIENSGNERLIAMVNQIRARRDS